MLTVCFAWRTYTQVNPGVQNHDWVYLGVIYGPPAFTWALPKKYAQVAQIPSFTFPHLLQCPPLPMPVRSNARGDNFPKDQMLQQYASRVMPRGIWMDWGLCDINHITLMLKLKRRESPNQILGQAMLSSRNCV